jgi:hypothetical protein
VKALMQITKSEIFVMSGATQRGIPDLLSCLLKYILADRTHKKEGLLPKDEGFYPQD